MARPDAQRPWRVTSGDGLIDLVVVAFDQGQALERAAAWCGESRRPFVPGLAKVSDPQPGHPHVLPLRVDVGPFLGLDMRRLPVGPAA